MKKIFIGFISFFIIATGLSQTNSGNIYRQLQSFNTCKRVLYIMLRPGEEDEKLLAYLSKKEHCNIAVLSITRGEQMTNYAGYEKNVDLGIIHTEELSKAASVSGFQPMATSMMDLGTYNSYNDIFSVWSEDTLVSNIVWAIRYFRPDIIITPKTNDSDSINNILINTIIDANSKAANKDYYSIQLAGRFSFLDINSAKQIAIQKNYWNKSFAVNQVWNGFQTESQYSVFFDIYICLYFLTNKK